MQNQLSLFGRKWWSLRPPQIKEYTLINSVSGNQYAKWYLHGTKMVQTQYRLRCKFKPVQNRGKPVHDLYQYGMSPVGYSFHAGVGSRQFTSSYVPVGIPCLNSFGSIQGLKCFYSTLTRSNFISVRQFISPPDSGLEVAVLMRLTVLVPCRDSHSAREDEAKNIVRCWGGAGGRARKRVKKNCLFMLFLFQTADKR